MRIAPQGQDIRFDEQQIVEGAEFLQQAVERLPLSALAGPIDPAADPFRHELSIFAKDLARQTRGRRFPASNLDMRTTASARSRRRSMISSGRRFCDRFIEAAKADLDDPRGRLGHLATIDYTLSAFSCCCIRSLPSSPKSSGTGSDSDPRAFNLRSGHSAKNNARAASRGGVSRCGTGSHPPRDLQHPLEQTAAVAACSRQEIG